MKPTIVLYILLSSIFTVVFSTHLLAASLPMEIDRSIDRKLYAQASDKTSIVGVGQFFKDEFSLNPSHEHLSKWYVTISKNGNKYIYLAQKEGKVGGKWVQQQRIRLVNGKLTKSGGKHFYKWNNGDTIYQVIWKPSDPEFARIQVLASGGGEIFNELMYSIRNGD
jgi:hypothetical protein